SLPDPRHEWPDGDGPESSAFSYGEEPDSGGRRLTCWRCDKVAVPVAGRCPYCHAKLEASLEERIILPPSKRGEPLLRVIMLLCGLVLASVIEGVVLATQAQAGYLPEAEWERRELISILVLEAVDTLLIVIGFAWIGLLPPLSKPEWTWRLASWIW